MDEGNLKKKTPWMGPWHCAHCGAIWELDADDKDKVTEKEGRYNDKEYTMPCPKCEKEATK